MLLRSRFCLRRPGSGVPLLLLFVLRLLVFLPGVSGSCLSTAAAAARGPVRPAGGLLRRRVLPSPGRWRDDCLSMDLDSDGAESAASPTDRATDGVSHVGGAGTR